MTKLLGSLVLAAMAVALTPKSALAKQGSTASMASFTCSVHQNAETQVMQHSAGQTILAAAAVANGAGYSSLGPLSFELQKTLTSPGIMQGCATLKSPNGDALYAALRRNDRWANGEGHASRSPDGTGRFLGATGSAKFTSFFVAPLSNSHNFWRRNPPVHPRNGVLFGRGNCLFGKRKKTSANRQIHGIGIR